MFRSVAIAVWCCASFVGWGQRLVVDAKGENKSVAAAVAMASPGDTIVVQPGIYREGNILIDKPLTLIGIGYPVLDGENQYEIITIRADHVTITGFKFIDTGTASIHDIAAVKVHDAHYTRIKGNTFVNTFFGVHFANSSKIWIEDNEMTASATADYEIGNGIHLWKCDHATIDGNIVKGHRDGIYFEFVTKSLIMNNRSEGNIRYGLHFMFSHDDEYRNNFFINNGAGGSVMYTKGVKMIGNTFSRNWGAASYGLLLKDIRDSFVKDNRFIENSTAIYMEGSSRMEFTENEFIRNGYAVKLQASCDDNNFNHNNFSGNTFDIATNGNLVLNTVDGNYWDRYEGYDLDKDGVGDVPYRPISLYSMVVERMPTAVLLWRSFFVFLMDRAEKAIPAITPENMKDNRPSMKPYDLD